MGKEKDRYRKVKINVQTSPFSWSMYFSVDSSYTVGKLIAEIRSYKLSSMKHSYTDMDEIHKKNLNSLEKTCMLLLKGKDLLQHLSCTLQELGVDDGDELIIRDKRPFAIKISMRKRESAEVVIEVHDTVQSLKEKIQTIVGVPMEKQRLCYVDIHCWIHHVIADDTVPLIDYGILKKWKDSGASQHEIWLYTKDDPGLEAGHCSPRDVVDSTSFAPSSQMEIVIQFYDDNQYVQYLHIAIESYYTVNQLVIMIQETKYLEQICVLVFRCMNLLEHGSSTLCDLGIKDQDKLLIPAKGPLRVMITFTFSLKVKESPTYVEVEAHSTVHNLKEKLKIMTNIPLKKQRLCYVRKQSTDEECHMVMNDDSRTLATYGIVKHGHCIGICIEDDHPAGADEGPP